MRRASQIFRKLNIGSRVELALIVIEQGVGDNLVRSVSTGR